MAAGMTTTPCPECEPVDKLRIRISVFMDGTGNNQFNVDHGREAHDMDEYDSYTADYSNVARLAQTMQTNAEEDYHQPIYVQGIGTKKGKADSDYGSGTGEGDYGISTRVTECMHEILDRVSARAMARKTVDRLRIDCFGFSRGAAAARHLISRLLISLRYFFSTRGITVSKFEIPFVGLFDTVSSYGVGYDSDTEQLHLDSIKDPIVERVVQLAAGDEHRLNFRLTNIASAGARGLEIFLPGAHSDIGGGYVDGDSEESRVLLEAPGVYLKARCEAMRTELIALGWFTDSEEIRVRETAQPDIVLRGGGTVKRDSIYDLVATREKISNRYSYLPLHMMSEYAGAKKLRFELTKYDYSGDPDLVAIRSLIDGNRHDGEYWIRCCDPQIQKLRHGYLHFSAHYAINEYLLKPHVPQFYSVAEQWSDDDSNRLHGQRRRRVMAG